MYVECEGGVAESEGLAVGKGVWLTLTLSLRKLKILIQTVVNIKILVEMFSFVTNCEKRDHLRLYLSYVHVHVHVACTIYNVV